MYADIPNIGEYLAQSQLSQTIIGSAECIGELPKDNGAKCCVLDNNTNRFAVIPVLPVKQVQAMLSQMGYSEISAKEIADKVVASYRETDKEKDNLQEEKPVVTELRRYEQNNAELEDMGYFNNKDSTIIVRDDNENYRYMQIEKDTPLKDAEKALRDELGLVDDISVALAMKQLISDGIINDAKTQEHNEAKVCQLSGNTVEITSKESGKSAIVPIKNIDVQKLTELGISEKTASDIKKSFEKNISEKSRPDKQTLGSLKKFAQDKFKEIS